MCRTYNSAMQNQGQGHTCRSCDLPFNSCPLHISWTIWKIFIIKLHSIRVHCLSLEPFGQFSLNFTQMFLSMKQHAGTAGPMTQLHRLKIKVILQGHVIYPSIPFHISWTLWAIFIKLHTNVPLSETVCRTNGSATQTLGQSFTSRSWDLPLYFVSAPYLLNHLLDFH